MRRLLLAIAVLSAVLAGCGKHASESSAQLRKPPLHGNRRVHVHLEPENSQIGRRLVFEMNIGNGNLRAGLTQSLRDGEADRSTSARHQSDATEQRPWAAPGNERLRQRLASDRQRIRAEIEERKAKEATKRKAGSYLGW